ncbi:effector-associated constant component EACC1 [Amycolatopsis sp. cmx-4-68]|uniref:effector-associated constant component EACC1 n=1 Tax=Amycolatopsis sp. cmx-4-68 TaxID=2790938 RepID=UPI0039788F31
MPEVEDTELRLRVTGEEAAPRLRALHSWLGREDELRGRVKLRNRPIAPGEMGGVADVLTVALGSSGAGAVLIRSLARSVSMWLTQSRADVTVTVTTTAESRKVEVDVRRARDPEAVLRSVEELLDPGRHGAA